MWLSLSQASCRPALRWCKGFKDPSSACPIRGPRAEWLQGHAGWAHTQAHDSRLQLAEESAAQAENITPGLFEPQSQKTHVFVLYAVSVSGHVCPSDHPRVTYRTLHFVTLQVIYLTLLSKTTCIASLTQGFFFKPGLEPATLRLSVHPLYPCATVEHVAYPELLLWWYN